jgi:hypothetical protein
MRWLEVRRHSLTKKGPARGRGSHLSAEGVALARCRTGSTPSCLAAAGGWRRWPRPTGCDGARLGFDGSGFVGVEFLRAPGLGSTSTGG